MCMSRRKMRGGTYQEGEKAKENSYLPADKTQDLYTSKI